MIHELHTAINRELTVHGIEIAPPAGSDTKSTLPLVTSRAVDSAGTDQPTRVAG